MGKRNKEILVSANDWLILALKEFKGAGIDEYKKTKGIINRILGGCGIPICIV